jgi:hypothetical protein
LPEHRIEHDVFVAMLLGVLAVEVALALLPLGELLH